MRRFIYYDKDGIESYLAQITAGISISSSKEITSSQEKSKMNENKRNITSAIGAKLAVIGSEIQEDITTGEADNQIVSRLVKSLEEKVMSDYAFDKVYDYFKNENIIKTNDFKIGDVISLNENVTFLILITLKNFFLKKELIISQLNNKKMS